MSQAVHCIFSPLKFLGHAFKQSVKCPVACSEYAPSLKCDLGSHGAGQPVSSLKDMGL
jgi:hypothetical protein